MAGMAPEVGGADYRVSIAQPETAKKTELKKLLSIAMKKLDEINVQTKERESLGGAYYIDRDNTTCFMREMNEICDGMRPKEDKDVELSKAKKAIEAKIELLKQKIEG